MKLTHEFPRNATDVGATKFPRRWGGWLRQVFGCAALPFCGPQTSTRFFMLDPGQKTESCSATQAYFRCFRRSLSSEGRQTATVNHRPEPSWYWGTRHAWREIWRSLGNAFPPMSETPQSTPENGRQRSSRGHLRRYYPPKIGPWYSCPPPRFEAGFGPRTAPRDFCDSARLWPRKHPFKTPGRPFERFFGSVFRGVS
jgi:hypothetical protein